MSSIYSSEPRLFDAEGPAPLLAHPKPGRLEDRVVFSVKLTPQMLDSDIRHAQRQVQKIDMYKNLFILAGLVTSAALGAIGSLGLLFPLMGVIASSVCILTGVGLFPLAVSFATEIVQERNACEETLKKLQDCQDKLRDKDFQAFLQELERPQISLSELLQLNAFFTQQKAFENQQRQREPWREFRGRANDLICGREFFEAL